MRVLVATTNPGKLRDFAAVAARFRVAIAPLPGLAELPPVAETGSTFAENAAAKAEGYSRHAPGEIVIADDSGLEVAALNGVPGIHSARYAEPGAANSPDIANNLKLLRELASHDDRSARFVCVIAAARDGRVLATFEGTANGEILFQPRGVGGFGYDPLFLFPALGKTFAELTAEEKANYSHRGQAFRKFLEWLKCQPEFLRATS